MEEINHDALGIKILRRKNSMTNRNLLIAANEGDKDSVESCIEQGANINFVDSDGNTPLHYAIESEKIDVVKYFADIVEDINVENNECKTPLDIAIALKQNDIIEMLSEKNIERSFEMLENQDDQQSEETVNKLTFMEATFLNDYKVPLSKDDIQNILDFIYFRGDRERVFKAIDSMEDMKKEVEVFLRDKKTTTLIFNLDIGWITIVLCYKGKGEPTAYYIDYLGSTINDLPTAFKEPFQSKSIEISDFQLKEQAEIYDSGIFSLKTAEVFHSSKEIERKENLQKLNYNEAKVRDFYANILLEKKRVEEKIAVCLEILQKLNKKKTDTEELNHKNANVIINFLETFALHDTFPERSNIWTQEELDQNQKELTDLKKDYISSYYFVPKKKQNESSDLSLIRSARKAILKNNTSKIIQPEDLKHFIKEGMNVSTFFEKLELYTKNIKDKINKNFENSHSDIYCHSFFKFQKIIGTPNGDFLKILREFLIHIYQPEDKIDQEKLIFNVLVNIIPILSKNNEKIRPLSVMRNNLVHNYHERSISNSERKFKEIKQLHSLRSEIFKYFYSKEVHGLLCNMLLGNNIKILQNEFQKILEDFQKETIKEENISVIPGEHLNSFEYIFQESLFPEDENISNIVDKYLKYAFIVEKKAGVIKVQIDDEAQEEFENRKLTDDEAQEEIEYRKLTDDEAQEEIEYRKLTDYEAQEEIERRKLTDDEAQEEIEYRKLMDDEAQEEIEYRKLTDDKKREIFEDFMKLKKSRESTPAQIQYERNKLKEKLKMYGLEVNYFDRVVGYYLDDSNELPDENIKKRGKIISILSILKKIKKDYSLTNNTIINLYENFLKLKQKGITHLKKYRYSFDKTLDKLNESQKSSILEMLCNFPGMETINIMIEEVKFAELNTFDIISNMLFVFCTSYDNYKFKFNNVEEAFNDDTFLDYLVSLNIELINNRKNLKDKYFVFTMIKKLITLEYACPFIAKLLIESNDATVIDKEDFVHLLKMLLKNNAYVKHLTKLLNIKSKSFDVYEEFCLVIFDNNLRIENLKDILQEYDHVKAILNNLEAMNQKIKSSHLMEEEALKVKEFCVKFVQDDFNIEHVHDILQDHSEVKGILNKLVSANIENLKFDQCFHDSIKKIIEFWEKNATDIDFNPTNKQEEFERNGIKNILLNLNAKVDDKEVFYCELKNNTIEQITQQILKQMNIITYELHCDSCYSDVVKILEVSLEASKKLKPNNELKNIILDAEFQKAKSIIQLSVEKSKRIDTKEINDALDILHRIKDDKERNPKYLLISAEIAYVQCLLKRYNESYKSYKRLFENIAHDISSDFKITSSEFIKLENSMEHQKMLAFSDDSKKYLNIVNIQNSIALNKTFEGFKLEKCKGYGKPLNTRNFRKTLDCHKEALIILEELYKFMRKSSKNTVDDEKLTMRIASKIASTKYHIGELLRREKKYENALRCYQEALVNCIQYVNGLKKIYTDFDPVFKKSKILITKILKNVAFTNYQFGKHTYAQYNNCIDKEKWKDIKLKYEIAQKINKKLLFISNSENEKKRRRVYIQKEGKKINVIKQKIKDLQESENM